MTVDQCKPTMIGQPNPGGGPVEEMISERSAYSPVYSGIVPQFTYDTYSGNTTFASSPNSLHMYDQERCDMQNTMSSCRSLLNPGPSFRYDDVFDLKPEFENTDSNLAVLLDDMPVNNDMDDDPLCTWTNNSASLLKMEDVFQVDRNDVIQGPTLAALNSSSADEQVEMFDSNLDNFVKTERSFVRSEGDRVTCNSVPLCQTENVKSASLASRLSGDQSRSFDPNSDTTSRRQISQSSHGNCMDYTYTGSFSVFNRGGNQSATAVDKDIDSKSSLHYLLTREKAGNTCSELASKACVPTLRGGISHKCIDNNMERKWEEIRQFIDEDDIKKEQHDEHENREYSVGDKSDDEEMTSDDESEENDGYSSDEGSTNVSSMPSPEHGAFSYLSQSKKKKVPTATLR